MDMLLRNQMLDDMGKIVRIPSVSSDKENVKEALDCFMDLAAGMGFRTETVCDGQIGVVEMGEGEEVLGILVHVDVVDIGDESQWTVPPFDVTVRDGRVYGAVKAVDEVPRGLMYTISTESGDVLLPHVDEFVKEIDAERGLIITPIPGFFD